MSTTRKPIRLETWIFAAVMVVLFALFAWRQFFRFNKNDEIFYISTVYRFFQGDAMLVDEWNNVQLFALLIYPFYSLIRLFHHSNAEMILIFRIGYLLVHGAAAASTRRLHGPRRSARFLPFGPGFLRADLK